jgi:ABC-type phosphate transport system substrate-binding protein
VIVNAANPGSQIKRDTLATIYLKGHARWADGKPVVAVDQSARSSVRASFTEQALGQDVQAVQNQWIRSIQVGQGTPPPVKSSDEDVVAFVKSNPNAIGYVSTNAPLDAAVKALKIVE